MIDKLLETNIKKTQDFLEFWEKFHKFYRNAVGGNTTDSPDPDIFISTRGLVASRFEELMDALDVRPKQRMLKWYPVYEILGIDDLSAVSDERLRELDGRWTDATMTLYTSLNAFKRKKQRLERFNTFVYVMKKMITRGGKK